MKYKTLFALSLSLLLVTSCSKEATRVPNVVMIDLSDIEETVSIHTEKQKELLESNDPASLIDNNLSEYGRSSLSNPSPVTFAWSEENDINQKASKYILKISENQYLDNALEYTTKQTQEAA